MPVVAVFGSSRVAPDDPDYREGVRLGSLLARAGLTVASGGYAGIMEAVSSGARAAGGAVIGVTAPEVFPTRTGANLHVTEEVTAATLPERIHRLVDLADASIAMPGSLGTVTEFLVAWNEGFVAPFRGARPKPQVAVGPLWGDLVRHLADRFGADASTVTCVATVDEAVSVVASALGLPRGAAAG